MLTFAPFQKKMPLYQIYLNLPICYSPFRPAGV